MMAASCKQLDAQSDCPAPSEGAVGIAREVLGVGFSAGDGHVSGASCASLLTRSFVGGLLAVLGRLWLALCACGGSDRWYIDTVVPGRVECSTRYLVEGSKDPCKREDGSYQLN